MRLIETTQKFVCSTEEEAKSLLEQYRVSATEKGYTVKKAGYEYKTKKSKGEIIGEVYVCTIVQTFGDVWGDLE